MPGDDRRIVRETTVAVNLTPVGEDAFHVVERVRALRMARQFGFLPRPVARMDLPAQGFHALVQLLDLPARLFVLSRNRLQMLDLFLDPGQFLLSF